ncbi:MAG: N-acetylmuramoyl-L-alanine amidase [Clostridia bacterium]|nr:N-acetylmuramoyl-L-alanine amidase [Clostridia bacterium]
MIKKTVSLILCTLFLLFSVSCTKIESGLSDETTEDSETEKEQEETSPAPVSPFDDGKTVICIDPGHGFGDVGCKTDFIDCYEKDLTLTLSLVLKEEFEAAGATVILTHDGESFPSVEEITREADKYGVEYNIEKMDENDIFGKYERAIWQNVLDRKYSLDMFISLHINSIEDHPEVRGVSIDYCTANPYAEMLSEFCDSLREALTEKSIAQSVDVFADKPEDSYVVTKYSTAPSVLIEAGYATSPADAANLLDEGWQRAFCSALCKTVTDAVS